MGKGCKLCRYDKVSKSKTMSESEYKDKLAHKNPTVILVGIYKNTSTKTMHRCLLHNIDWLVTPESVLQGSGCEKCHIDRIADKKKLSDEEYKTRLIEINSNIIVLDKYIDMKTPILHQCLIHNVIWKTTPSSVLQGCGCFRCGSEKISLQLKKTHDQYVNEVYEINPNIKVIGEYVNAYTAIAHQCLIDEYIWYPKPHNVLNGYGCPVCAGNMKLTEEEYIKRLKDANPNTVLVGSYIDTHTPVLHKCLKHDYTWNLTPSCALKGTECLYCGRDKMSLTKTKSHEQYVEELNKVNPNIYPIEEYIKSRLPIKHQCKIDGFVWEVTPTATLRGSGCPLCNENKGERTIRLWLEDNNINYIPQMKFDQCKDIRALPFDFYLPDLNICIEYDGIQHYKPNDFFGGEEAFMVYRWHDNIKNQYCEDNDIPLLRIRYNDNIEEKLKTFLSI